MIPFPAISHAITDAVAALEIQGNAGSAAALRIHGPELMRLARLGAADHQADPPIARPATGPYTKPKE